MLKVKRNWLMASSAIFLMTCCVSPSSIATSESCSGNMVVENSRYKEVFSKKREHKVKGHAKFQRKGKSEF